MHAPETVPEALTTPAPETQSKQLTLHTPETHKSSDNAHSWNAHKLWQCTLLKHNHRKDERNEQVTVHTLPAWSAYQPGGQCLVSWRLVHRTCSECGLCYSHGHTHRQLRLTSKCTLHKGDWSVNITYTVPCLLLLTFFFFFSKKKKCYKDDTQHSEKKIWKKSPKTNKSKRNAYLMGQNNTTCKFSEQISSARQTTVKVKKRKSTKQNKNRACLELKLTHNSTMPTSFPKFAHFQWNCPLPYQKLLLPIHRHTHTHTQKPTVKDST